MHDYEPELYATMVNNSTGEIVYLLRLETPNHELLLLQMSEGTEKDLNAGTEYEIRELAEATERSLKENGFEKRKDGTTFDTLRSTIAVAIRLGYAFIHDSRQLSHPTRPQNFLGRIPLKDWKGATGSEDNNWEYALDYGKIYGRPRVTVPMPPKKMSGKEFAGVMLSAAGQQRALGGQQAFPIFRY